MNVKDIRRENLRYLSKQSGGISALARRLGKSQSQVSHIIGVHPIKNIGDRLAAHIEKTFTKPPGWLDREHPEILREMGIEPGAILERASPIKWVPVIMWQHVREWLNHENKSALHLISEYIPITLNLSRKSFATKAYENLANHSSEGKTEFFIPKDAVIVIDPEYPISDLGYVLALNKHNNKIGLNKFFQKNEQSQLKNLDANTPSVQAASEQQIIGVVRSVQINLDKQK